MALLSRRPVVRSPRPLLLLAGVLACLLALPFSAFLVRLGQGGPTGFGQAGLASAFVTSACTATVSTVILAFLGVPLGYALARSRSPWAGVVRFVVQLPLAVPPLMGGVLLLYLVGPYTPLGELSGGRLTDTVGGIVLAQCFVAAPFVVIAARSAFRAIPPQLEESATVLGLSPTARFRRVALPAAAAGVQAGLLLAWLRAFGEFGATVMLAYHPYSLPVWTSVQFSSRGLAATAAPTVLALAAAAVVAGTFALWSRRSARRRPVTLPAAVRPSAGPVRRTAVPVRGSGASGETVSFRVAFERGDFSLEAATTRPAHRLAVLGPSGAGKTSLLRCLAGLEQGWHGQVGDRARGHRTDGAAAAADRLEGNGRVGYVPQDAGLFPHLNVADQVCFGEGVDPGVASHWVESFGLTPVVAHRPDELSGGQRRRVCLAQALSIQPSLLLLDEPFCGLDTPVRTELRSELRHLQREHDLATVLVTHDPEDAAVLADELLVLVDGRVVQSGTCRDVLARPASLEVARLFGSENVGRGRLGAPGRLQASGTELEIAPRPETGPRAAASPGPVLWRVASESVAVGTDGPHRGRIVDRWPTGGRDEVVVQLLPGPRLTARADAGSGPDVGDECRVTIPPAAVDVWPEGGGADGAGGRAGPVLEPVPELLTVADRSPARVPA